LEQTYGLTSQDNVVFRQNRENRERVWELLALTFDSLLKSRKSSKAGDSVGGAPVNTKPTELPISRVPLPHPSLLFAEQVIAVIEECLPRGAVTTSPDPALADYHFSYNDTAFHVETKWKADLTQPFTASTLSHIMDRIGDEDKLLVVLDGVIPPGSPRLDEVREDMGDRVKIIVWQSKGDKGALYKSLESLLGDHSEEGSIDG
jgi:hypothetical protein